MPTYEYKCRECGITFERFQHFAEEPLRVCPECGGAVQRVVQPVGIIFKGKGFYVTDNKGASSTLPKSAAEVAETAAKATAAAAPSEAKPEAPKPAAPSAD